MTDPPGEFQQTRNKPATRIPGAGLVWGLLFSIPLWALIIAAIYSVVLRMVLIALMVTLLAAQLPDRWRLLANTMLLSAVGLVALGVMSALDHWI